METGRNGMHRRRMEHQISVRLSDATIQALRLEAGKIALATGAPVGVSSLVRKSVEMYVEILRRGRKGGR